MFRNLNKISQIRTLATSSVRSDLTTKNKILNKLKQKYGYNLMHAEVNNSSWKHDRPQGEESHLELIAVTTTFEGQKKSSREEEIRALLSEEIKNLEEFKTTLLTPSKWYDSNLRGLKLETKYCEAPFGAGKLKEIVNNFNATGPK